MNPVRAKLVETPAKWKWSSAAAHLKRKDDKLVKAEPLTAIVQKPWEKFLS
jgi:putative transposase